MKIFLPAGIGLLLLLPLLMVAPQLEDGSLVRVISDWAPRREIIHAVFPYQRGNGKSWKMVT